MRFVQKLNLTFGTLDTITGLMLIIVPKVVMACLGLEILDSEISFLKYIGAFVLATGSSYFLPYFTASTHESINFLRHIWISTAFTRLTVFTFICSHILLGELEINWLTVALSDLSIALLQLYYLKSLAKQDLC